MIAARPGDGEVALDPPEVEVVVEPGHEERDVDVGGHDLLVIEPGHASSAVGSHPLEDAAPRKDRGDHATVVERDPVADGREIRTPRGPRSGTPR